MPKCRRGSGLVAPSIPCGVAGLGAEPTTSGASIPARRRLAQPLLSPAPVVALGRSGRSPPPVLLACLPPR